MIRALEDKDIDQIRKIHAAHYKHEFSFPDFLSGFLCGFVVTNDENDREIVSAGGVRMIAESVIVTNRDCSVRARRAALFQVMDASEFITRNAGLNQLHAFIQDDKWYRHLTRIGFVPTVGKSLVLNLDKKENHGEG